MWRAAVRITLPVVTFFSTSYTCMLLKLYIISKKYNKVIKIYNKELMNNLTNEGVEKYIENINKIPKVSKQKIDLEEIKVMIKVVNDNNNISRDLKEQLKIVLKLKGIDVF